MTIEKRDSGTYRAIQMVDGVRYRVSFDHKPTKIEAMKALSAEMEKTSIGSDSSFEQACLAYIEQKSNVLSVTTISGYRSIMKRISPLLLMTKVDSITLPMVQTEVNKYSASHSAKSVSNLAGFIMSVLYYFGSTIQSPKLPQKEKKAPYIPSEDDVKAIFAEIKGTKYEIPILLSAMGLRRSEICALTLDDLDGTTLTINKAKVQNDKREWVIKTTKTVDSTRTIVIPDYLANLIRETGYIYEGHPELIYRTLTDVQKKLGIPHFPLHKMRHFFASYMHNLGYTDKQIQDMGGWKTTDVLQKVYQHSMELDEAKKSAASDMGKLM